MIEGEESESHFDRGLFIFARFLQRRGLKPMYLEVKNDHSPNRAGF
jgi:hypothetical protein